MKYRPGDPPREVHPALAAYLRRELARISSAIDAPRDVLALRDGSTEPDQGPSLATLYVDVTDGDLKIKFADGTIKTIVVDT